MNKARLIYLAVFASLFAIAFISAAMQFMPDGMFDGAD
jgi:hypothetical protein